MCDVIPSVVVGLGGWCAVGARSRCRSAKPQRGWMEGFDSLSPSLTENHSGLWTGLFKSLQSVIVLIQV